MIIESQTDIAVKNSLSSVIILIQSDKSVKQTTDPVIITEESSGYPQLFIIHIIYETQT